MKYIQLNVDRSQLDPKFDGYKVSMDDIHFESKKLEQSLCLRSPSSSMVSLQHMKVFSNDNQLYCNVDRCTDTHDYLYRILDTGHIQELTYDKVTRQWENQIVGSIGLEPDSPTPGFPVNLFFAQHGLAVASNGISEVTVYLEVPGTMVNMVTWKLPGAQGVCLMEAKMFDEKLHFLVYEVESAEEAEARKSKTRSRIHWVKVNLDDIDVAETLTVEKVTEYVVNGHFETCTFSDDGQIIFLGSEKPHCEDDSDELAVLEQSWSQTGHIVEVKFSLGGFAICKEDVEIDVTKTRIKLSVKDVVLLNGKLGGEIDENDVEVLAQPHERHSRFVLKLKATSTEKWAKLIVLETAKMKTVEDEEMEKMAKEEQEVYGSDEPMEECDEGDNSLGFYWMDKEKGKVVAQCDVSGSQLLFTRRDDRHPAEFCLRHDVDGLLWSFTGPAPRHVATLQAFGYVQASKTTRLWSGCSPNCSLACIVEGNNRVLLYSQKVEVSGNLSNRKTSQTVSHISKQHLLRVDCPHSIRGVFMTDTHIYAATKEHIHVAELTF